MGELGAHDPCNTSKDSPGSIPGGVNILLGVAWKQENAYRVTFSTGLIPVYTTHNGEPSLVLLLQFPSHKGVDSA